MQDNAGQNGREYRLAEVPHLSVDGCCPETKKVFEVLACFWHGHTCLPFRDVETVSGDTLAETYENTMARLDQILRAGYQVEIQCECEFDDGILHYRLKLETHPLVEHIPPNT
jgi:G:T-mismatch repair DNA endonuclease (very short patch repair protein)